MNESRQQERVRDRKKLARGQRVQKRELIIERRETQRAKEDDNRERVNGERATREKE